MNYDEIMNEINNLEEVLAEVDYGSYAYDCIDAELQVLYMDLESLKKDKKVVDFSENLL
jgi:hypothetical protein